MAEVKQNRKKGKKPEAVGDLSAATFPDGGGDSLFRLQRDLKIGPGVLADALSPLLKKHPGSIVEIPTANGRRACYVSARVSALLRSQFRADRFAPEGWITVKAAAAKLGLGAKLVASTANKLRGEFPELFGDYYTPKGLCCLHYNLDLLPKIAAKLAKEEKVSPNWKTANQIAVDLDVHPSTVRDRINELRLNYPTDIKFSRDSSNIQREYVSPQIVTILGNLLNPKSPAPENWVTVSTLAAAWRVDQETIERRLPKFRESNPEYFSFFRTSARLSVEHISPDLVSIIEPEITGKVRADLERFPRPQPGWSTTWLIAQTYGFTPKYVSSFVYRYWKGSTDATKECLNSWNFVNRHLSPELCNIIRRQLLTKTKPPLGWNTAPELARQFGISLAMSREIVKETGLAKSRRHRRWFTEENGERKVYYSPQLISDIKHILSRRRLLPTKAAETLGSLHFSERLQGEILAELQIKHPQEVYYLKEDPGRFTFWIKPRIEDELRALTMSASRPPPGWFTCEILSRKIGVSPLVAERLALEACERFTELNTIARAQDELLKRFFSPELIEILQGQLTDIPPAARKALRISEVAQVSGLSVEQTLAILVPKLKAEIGVFRFPDSELDVGISPRGLVSAKRLLDLVSMREKPIKDVTERLGVSEPTLKDIAAQFGQGGIRSILGTKKGQTIDYCEQAFVERAEEFLKNSQWPPQEWTPLGNTIKTFGLSTQETVKIYTDIADIHPGEIGEYLDLDYKPKLFVSVLAAEKFLERLTAIDQSLEPSWTLSRMHRTVGGDYNRLKSKISVQRNLSPQEFEIKKDCFNRKWEVFSNTIARRIIDTTISGESLP